MWKGKDSYGKCRGIEQVGDTKHFFFSVIFPAIILKAHFIIKFHVEIKECFDFFSSFSQTEREPFHRTVQVAPLKPGVTSV